jgi:hypothetical protein
MPLPTAYTESSLSAFMEAELGAVGTDLAIADGDALTEAVNEVAGLFGVSNVASITSIANTGPYGSVTVPEFG